MRLCCAGRRRQPPRAGGRPRTADPTLTVISDPLRPETFPGPIACPPWCSRVHPGPDDNVEDGIMHTSEAVVWDMPVNREFPRLQFDLVSFDTPERRTSTVLEVSAVTPGAIPKSFDVHNGAELDQVISELRRTIAALEGWRRYLPEGRSVA
ncbi:DUF6907 domain-containing protein [Streptomyces sp. NPDC001389]|uniref:DUF6907 domain-containing protein n=1 Tax=Streptomyces sp. NPDC001389 TaxID=3364569 RepID=UPI00368224C3